MFFQRPVQSLMAIFSILIITCCLMTVVKAQSATATLSGTVEDQNGAVVVGATVMIVNIATGLQRTATTNDKGGFVVPLLPPATYKVRVERDGFAPVEVPTVVLNVGDQKALQIQLQAGDVRAQVVVDSNAETIRTDGSVGTVVNRQFVANMPLNGRTLQSLIQLSPGVVLTAAPSASGTTGGSSYFSVNGQRSTSNNWMVDGVSANTGMAVSASGRGIDAFPSGSGQTPGTTALGGTNSLVSLDALQEFRIETSTFAAEFGRTPGGQISLVTRGGTNQFHGSASEYFRNEALDANDWFANANRLPKPKERQNLFGGVLGGPIRKDRLFFFGSYEGLRLRQPQVKVITVPSATFRAQAVTAVRSFLNAVPLPNGPDLGDGGAQFAASYSDAATFNIFALRLDGRVTDKLTAFFRFSHAPSDSTVRVGSLSSLVHLQVQNNAYTGGLTWIVSPRLTADFRVNWTRNLPQDVFDLDTFGGAVVPNESDVFAPGFDRSSEFFNMTSTNGIDIQWGAGTSDLQRQFNAVGTVIWLVGSHQVKFGVDYRRLLPIFGTTPKFQESLGFFPSSQPLLNGQLSGYFSENHAPTPREAIIPALSLFAQDAWRINPRLTLTYGVRFERIPSPGEATGQLPRTVLGIESDPPQSPRLAPVGTPLFHSRFGYFAPRFGAAYQLGIRPGWETTLRGGAGVFYDLGLGDVASAFQFLWPFAGNRSASNLSFPLSAVDRAPRKPGIDPPSSLYPLFEPNQQLPFTTEWNVSWEQGIGHAQSISLSYVGAAGRRLLVQQSYRQTLVDFPAAVNLFVERNLGSSSYRALQFQYRRRLNRGVQALASYTLASSRDNSSDQSFPAPPASQGTLLAENFGPSEFDVRHVLSAAITYDLPGPSGPVLLRALASDWGLDLMIRYQSAFPFTPTAGSVFSPSANLSFTRRPDQVSGQPLYIYDSSLPGGRRANRAAFVQPPSGQQGNFPRNGLRGFPASQVDLALRREFKLAERVKLQLRGEFFNVFNHPNFGIPRTASITSGNFGKPTQMLNRSLGGLNGLYAMGGPRSGQIAVKVSF